MQAQSFISTLMRVKFGVYETRLFMRIVQKCQALLPNNMFQARAYQTPGQWSYRFAFTLSSFTHSHNYNYVKAACENLKNITVEKYDTDKARWEMAGLITQAKIDEQSGLLILEVADWVCKMIIDFRKGWRIYNLDNALRIRNPYALRMYLITCTQEKTIPYTVEQLKDTLLGKGNNKYKNNGDFIRRCIMPAQKELEDLHLNGFSYTTKKGNGAQKGRILSVNIKPVKRENKDENISATRKAIGEVIPDELLQYLTIGLGFTTRELKGKNLETIKKFITLPNWQGKFLSMVTRLRKARKGHGWLINAMKKEGGIQ